MLKDFLFCSGLWTAHGPYLDPLIKTEPWKSWTNGPTRVMQANQNATHEKQRREIFWRVKFRPNDGNHSA